MKQHLRKKRDKIIRNLWIDNWCAECKNGADFYEDIKEIFSNPPSIPTFYRIIKAVSQQCETEVQGSHKTGSKENLKETNAA